MLNQGREQRATAQDLAVKIGELMQEDLVGFTKVEENQVYFEMINGQKFVLCVQEAD